MGTQNGYFEKIIDSTGAVYAGRAYTNSGTVRLSYADGQAFLWDTGATLTPYQIPSGVTNKGARRYMAVISEGTDSVAGYLDLDSAGEALGSELITNGTMEADANWSNYGTPTTNERSTTQVHAGTYSRKFVADAASEGIEGAAYSFAAGKLYKLVAWVFPVTNTSVRLRIWDGDGTENTKSQTVTGLTADTWNQITIYLTSTVTGAGAYLSIISPAAQPTGTWYVDDVSVKEVTDVTAVQGVKLFDSLSGGSQNIIGAAAAGIAANFTPNGTLTYKIVPVW